MKNLELVGTSYFNQKIVISDPCYNSIGIEYLQLPYSGVYNCYASFYEGRVSSISIVLSNTSLDEVKLGEEVVGCSVDSGQLGIFNKIDYRGDISKEVFNTTINRVFPYEDWCRDYNENENKFYLACCNITLSNNRVGILENIGVVSSSGYGDGFYPVYSLLNNSGTVVGYKVVFIRNK